MLRNPFLLAARLALAGALAGPGFLRAADDWEQLQVVQPTSPSALSFPNPLTDVQIKDETQAPATFDDLYRNAQKTGSSVNLRQQVGDQIVIEQSTKIGVERDAAAPLSSTIVPGSDTASTYHTLGASWKPLSPLTLRFTTAAEENLDSAQKTDPLLMDSRRFEAAWQAAPKASLTLSDSTERDFDYSTSAYDERHETALTYSQGLGKQFTWNATPAWRQDTEGGDFPSVQAGPQVGTSLDWKPADGTKWTLGGGWNRMDAVANAVEQSTHDLYLAYDRSVGQKLKFLFRSDYERLTSPRTVNADALQQDQVSFLMGQRYTLSDGFSAQVDFRHTFQQQNNEAWGTSDSMATFSLKKVF